MVLLGFLVRLETASPCPEGSSPLTEYVALKFVFLITTLEPEGTELFCAVPDRFRGSGGLYCVVCRRILRTSCVCINGICMNIKKGKEKERKIRQYKWPRQPYQTAILGDSAFIHVEPVVYTV